MGVPTITAKKCQNNTGNNGTTTTTQLYKYNQLNEMIPQSDNQILTIERLKSESLNKGFSSSGAQPVRDEEMDITYTCTIVMNISQSFCESQMFSLIDKETH